MLVERWFDKTYVRSKGLEVKDLVLKWDKLNEKKGKHSMFQHLWFWVHSRSLKILANELIN